MIVRVPARGADWIGFTLDAGAAGIMVPHVNSVQEAEALVANAVIARGIAALPGPRARLTMRGEP